jgi:hypothetical protein
VRTFRIVAVISLAAACGEHRPKSEPPRSMPALVTKRQDAAPPPRPAPPDAAVPDAGTPDAKPGPSHPRVTYDGQYFKSSDLPAASADGSRVAVLHVQSIPEADADGSAELRIVEVKTDKIVERIASTGQDLAAKVPAMNARLDHETWTPLTEGEIVSHCPGEKGRDSDACNCELRAGDVAIHYAPPRLTIDRKGTTVLMGKFASWGEGEGVGFRTAYRDAAGRFVLVILTYHHFGDEERGPPDEEHVLLLKP